MSKQRNRRQHRHSPRGPAPSAQPAPSFTPVTVRARHDGWTPVRQDAFIKALAACANVEEACAAVGMSPRSYYDLRSRPDAASFRQAAEAALDAGVGRLADAMLGRALHGEVTPVFYRGEQIGERRRYDNRLGMFILRVRQPERYGKWRDGMQQFRDHPDGAHRVLGHALRALAEDNRADAAGKPRPQRAPLKTEVRLDDPAEQLLMEEERERQAAARHGAEHLAYLRTLDAQNGGAFFGPDSSRDVA